jgi:hypothetical protein
MKNYEISRQGSRFVVKTREGNGNFDVSAPFRTHAEAQKFIDQQCSAAENLAHDEPDQKKVSADSESYDAIGEKYGFTVFEGKQYALTEKASFARVYGLGISADNYSAACIDANGIKYTAYFEILEKDANNEVLADWDNASLVNRV